jgi:hypothetical protein
MFGIVTTGLLARMLSKQELGAYFLALSIVSLGAVVGSLGLPKTVVGLVAENMGVGRPERARRVIRTVLGLGVFGALGVSLAHLLVGDRILRTSPVRNSRFACTEFSETHTPVRKPLTQAVRLLARKPRCVGDKQRWRWSGYEF